MVCRKGSATGTDFKFENCKMENETYMRVQAAKLKFSIYNSSICNLTAAGDRAARTVGKPSHATPPLPLLDKCFV